MNSEIRINKYIADSGMCSRRAADKLIEAGKVTIDGRPAQTGERVRLGQKVCVNGKRVVPKTSDEHVYIALYKPTGITCTTDLRRRDNIITFLGYPERLFTVGRLDRDSEGLIFLTNDGSIVNRILRAESANEKEYEVTVDKPITDDFLHGMANGVPILGTVTKPCTVRKVAPDRFRIILTQGLNRQIRRMCEYFGFNVTRLVRTRIMHVTLSGLRPGDYRPLTWKEVEELNRLTSS